MISQIAGCMRYLYRCAERGCSSRYECSQECANLWPNILAEEVSVRSRQHSAAPMLQETPLRCCYAAWLCFPIAYILAPRLTKTFLCDICSSSLTIQISLDLALPHLARVDVSYENIIRQPATSETAVRRHRSYRTTISLRSRKVLRCWPHSCALYREESSRPADQ